LKSSHAAPIDLIAGQNDDMVIGARKAFEDHSSGEEWHRWNSLPYIGCNYCPGVAQKWMLTAALTASVITPAVSGLALDMMVRTLRSNVQVQEHTLVAPVSFPKISELSPKPCAGQLSTHGLSFAENCG
jgi:hypothetical protein